MYDSGRKANGGKERVERLKELLESDVTMTLMKGTERRGKNVKYWTRHEAIRFNRLNSNINRLRASFVTAKWYSWSEIAYVLLLLTPNTYFLHSSMSQGISFLLSLSLFRSFLSLSFLFIIIIFNFLI